MPDGFEIDGRTYEIPALGDFTMAEAQILYDASGLTIEDFLLDDDGDNSGFLEKLRNPGLMRALMHVAYQRGNPDLRATAVVEAIGKVNYLEALTDLIETRRQKDGDDQGPLDITKPPDGPSPTGSDVSSTSSGRGSPTGSEPPAETPDGTGTTRSATSSTPARSLSAA